MSLPMKLTQKVALPPPSFEMNRLYQIAHLATAAAYNILENLTEAELAQSTTILALSEAEERFTELNEAIVAKAAQAIKQQGIL